MFDVEDPSPPVAQSVRTEPDPETGRRHNQYNPHSLDFRNRIVQLYDRIDPKIVYAILTQRRKDLLVLADLLTRALEGESGSSTGVRG
ncbi:MAG: DUF86 domain-containing protein [Deltaproteobacteria bacterium]|nr:DUF86 domain-containing protein [Deltaproteobacteria bacterium]